VAWALILLAWLILPVAQAAQTLTLELTAPEAGTNGYLGWEFTAEILASGKQEVISLPREAPRIWSGTVSVDPVQFVGVMLRAQSPNGGDAHLVYSGLEVLTSEDSVLHFAMVGQPPGTAHRMSRTAEQSEVGHWTNGVALLSAAWCIGALVLVLGLYRRSRGPLKTGLMEAGWTFKAAWEPAFWVGASLLWTWPAALAGPDRLVGRHFDTHGTIWTIDAAPRLLTGLMDPLTRWPLEAEYGAMDSFVLLPIAAAMNWVGAVRLHAWLGILGVALSAWAASGFARAMGAQRPWSLIAGGVFAFSGLAANALLEGHVYQVVNPWMPWMCWAIWRGTGPEGRLHHGLLGGLCFSLSLLTTGYLGVAAAVLALGLFIGGLWTRRAALLPVMAGFAAVALPVGLVYLSVFMGSDGAVASEGLSGSLRTRAVSMVSIGMASAEVDRVGHSWALALSPIAITLCLLAPRALGRKYRWRALLLSGLAALFIAMGPDLVVGLRPDDPVIPSPLGWIWDMDGGGYLRFPGRISWAWNLVAGVVGALVAQTLASHVGRRARWILIAAALEAFILVGLPWRQVSRPASTPAVYHSASGPVFELLPEGSSSAGEVDSWLSAMSCLYQTDHHQPIGDDCVTVPATGSPRAELGRWVAARILEGDGPRAWSQIADLGFSAVSWNPDLVHPANAARVGSALSTLEKVKPDDASGSDQVQLYRLAPAAQVSARLPDAERASAIIADPVSGTSWELRATLALPEASETSGRYFVLLGHPDSEQLRLEFSDNGRVPGDRADDGLMSTVGSGTGSELLRLSIAVVRSGEWTTLWSGPYQPLSGQGDSLAFRMDPSGDAAWPILSALDTLSPEAGNRAGWIHLFGWGLFGLMFTVLVWRHPRQ